MAKEIDIKKVNVGKVGHFDIEIPVLKVGNGNPKLTLITGMHGDEYTGLLIIKRLIDELTLEKGTLQIILSANPLARSIKKRESLHDSLDLNRTFPGSQKGTITERIAHKLLYIIGDNDLLIDLHTMQNNTKPTVIFINCNNETDKKSWEYIKCFNHERVWQITTTEDSDKIYGQSLCAFLSRQHVPSFALEINNVGRVGEKDIENSVNGLKSVMSKMGMINGEYKVCSPVCFKRNKIYGDYSGIFIPLKEVDDKITPNDLIGQILDIHDLKIKDVKPPISGFICDITGQSFVNEGDHIFSIGEIKNAD